MDPKFEIYVVVKTIYRNNIPKEEILCSFEDYEDSQYYLKTYSEQIGYKLKYNEYGVITGSYFFNDKKKVSVFLTIEIIQVY